MICAEANHPQRAAGTPTDAQIAANTSPINDFQHQSKQKAPTKAGAFHYNMVPETGVEPTTYAMRPADLHQLLEVFCLKPSLDLLKRRSRSREILMDIV